MNDTSVFAFGPSLQMFSELYVFVFVEVEALFSPLVSGKPCSLRTEKSLNNPTFAKSASILLVNYQVIFIVKLTQLLHLSYRYVRHRPRSPSCLFYTNSDQLVMPTWCVKRCELVLENVVSQALIVECCLHLARELPCWSTQVQDIRSKMPVIITSLHKGILRSSYSVIGKEIKESLKIFLVELLIKLPLGKFTFLQMFFPLFFFWLPYLNSTYIQSTVLFKTIQNRKPVSFSGDQNLTHTDTKSFRGK